MTENDSQLSIRDEQGIRLRSLADLTQFADILRDSGVAPKSLKISDRDRAGLTPEQAQQAERNNIICALQMGAEVGLPPMASMQNIAVVNGRPSIWGDAMLGVVRKSGELEAITETKIVDHDEDKCGYRVTVKRRGYEPASETFTVKDAKRAGLWAKPGPWTQHPFRMLKYRARAFVLRDQFGDFLRGLHSVEELRDQRPTVRDVTPPTFHEEQSQALPKPKRHRCQATACRKMAAAGSHFCADHTVEAELPKADGPFPEPQEPAGELLTVPEGHEPADQDGAVRGEEADNAE